jgi:hypothetical protein
MLAGMQNADHRQMIGLDAVDDQMRTIRVQPYRRNDFMPLSGDAWVRHQNVEGFTKTV